MHWKIAAAVSVGGAIGTCLRYAINTMITTESWFNATLIVNCSGSFLLGMISGWFLASSKREWIRLGLGTGLCGGYTTMSTFAGESVRFATETGGHLAPYLFLSLAGGLIAAAVGFLTGKTLGERRCPQ
ncbi:fluoride efflux transporter FluC [Alkalicoccobacillus plakortidis]|uniref:Fluoride-specific ion channel FluC n=1 Tax=Alkalicoccobacillus plakortidis TaxID=444060 RepID=A0ABT0XP31_9BACI|nr:CrcB family protein [Alkalicoccobacillus plakortidis]MCM2677022.1 CrcB family protein [Alkalicoccobacillus plakortidis]